MIMPKDVQKIWKEFKEKEFRNYNKFCSRLTKELNFKVVEQYYYEDYNGDINNVTIIRRNNFYVRCDYDGIEMYYNFKEERN